MANEKTPEPAPKQPAATVTTHPSPPATAANVHTGTPPPAKVQVDKAAKARDEAIRAKRYTINHAGVGGFQKGEVVDRAKFGNFTLDPRREATEDEVDAGLARLIDLGAIGPAPEEDE